MKSATHQPTRLDVVTFAKAQARLDGHVPLQRMARLAAGLHGPVDAPPAEVSWSAEGLWSRPAAGEPEVRIRLRAQVTVWLTCQRCLQPLPLALDIDRTLRFARDEDEAVRLDEEGEEDVLAITRTLDLLALVEDELILALPVVPRHEVCPQPLPWSETSAAAPQPLPEDDEVPHPFAALQSLKKSR